MSGIVNKSDDFRGNLREGFNDIKIEETQDLVGTLIISMIEMSSVPYMIFQL